MLLKNQTAWSKQNPSSTALKQRHAKTRFQIPHLLRNIRLRNSEPVSRPAKTSRFGDREKIAEVADVERLLFRLVAGLDFPDTGELLVGEERIVGPTAERGLFFQDPNLFP